MLCLHGGATSSTIFRHQLRHLEASLGDRAELVFFDGRNKVSKSQPEVERAFPGGPYYVHLERVMDKEPETCDTMGTYIDKAQGVAWLMEVVDQHGPFAAWIGFSQGANLALMALQSMATDQAEPLSSRRWPRAVIFMCPTQFGWFEPGAAPFHSDSISIICVIGKLDSRIARSRSFLDKCLSPELLNNGIILEHPEGHRPLPGVQC
jgi:pimeloyl-ACP methyl ester carboxylesterase